MRGKPFWAGVIATAAGTLFTVVGLWFTYDALTFRSTARAAIGTVTHVETVARRDSDTGKITHTYRPTLSYTGANGGSYQGETHISSSSYNYAIGHKVEILYDPGDSGDVRISGFFSLYTMPIVFTLGGLAMIGGGLVAFRAHRARQGNSPP